MGGTGQPWTDTNEWKNKRPLKYQNGSERAETVMLACSTVALDTKLRRRLSPGTLLCKMTSGHLQNSYGPYDKTATNGRQTISAGDAKISWEAHDVTLFDRAVAGLYAQCVFDLSELTLNGVSLHGASLTSLKNAFPTCTFAD
jgi:hypothetical protein